MIEYQKLKLIAVDLGMYDVATKLRDAQNGDRIAQARVDHDLYKLFRSRLKNRQQKKKKG